MMLSKGKNTDALWDLEHVLTHSNRGIYFFTANSPWMQRLVAGELKSYNIALIDFSKLNMKYSYYYIERFVNLNEDKKIFLIINLQNAMKDQYDIMNLNLSRNMLTGLKKILVFGMTEYLEDKISLKALDLYSYVTLNVSFEDETPERGFNYKFLSGSNEFIDLGFIDSLLKDYSEDIYSAENYESMASLYNKKFAYDESLKWYFKALEIKEKMFDNEDLTIANSYNNIGRVYKNKGDYDESLKWNFKALEIREKKLGIENIATIDSYSNISEVYRVKGDYDESLKWQLKALELGEKLFGIEGPPIAAIYNNVGIVYSYRGDYEKALEFYFSALKIYGKVYDEEKTVTASIYNNIGVTYSSKGNCDKALEFCFKALDIFKKMLIEGNPAIATAYNNIGEVYRYKGDYNKALEFYLKALEIRRKSLGENHPDTKRSVDDIDYINEIIK